MNTEQWDCAEECMYYKLYIHSSKDEAPYCNLYSGNSDDAEVFSERNLISELKKRGFNIGGVDRLEMGGEVLI